MVTDKKKSPNQCILSLSELIEKFYTSKKTKKIILKDKEQKQISSNCNLNEEERQRLISMSESDESFETPFNILSCCGAINNSKLSGELISFVKDVLKRDALLSRLNIESFLDSPNPDMDNFFRSVLNSEPMSNQNIYKARKLNILSTLLMWFMITREWPLWSLLIPLYKTIWRPRVTALSSKGRALEKIIPIIDNEGIALVGDVFYRMYEESKSKERNAINSLDLLTEEKNEFKEKTIKLENEVKSLYDNLKRHKDEIESLKLNSESKLASLQSKNDFDLLSYKNELKSLRTGIIRKLLNVMSDLQTGVQALESPVPRQDVTLRKLKILTSDVEKEIHRLQTMGE